DSVVKLNEQLPDDTDNECVERLAKLMQEQQQAIQEGGSTAAYALRLTEQGKIISVVSGGTPEGTDMKVWRLVVEQVTMLYYKVFPEVGTEAKAFVKHCVSKVNQRSQVSLEQALLSNSPAFLPGPGLINLIELQKQELQQGTFCPKVGWIVKGHAELEPFDMSFGKYRMGKAISDVARQVNAKAVVFVGDAIKRNEKCEIVGELLLIMIITPDGLSTSSTVEYSRTPVFGKQLGKPDFLTFSHPLQDDKPRKQNLIP